MLEDIDTKRIVEIYNSNEAFISQHLGKAKIYEELIVCELKEMEKISFDSCKIVDKFSGEIVGLCDFKTNKTAYLSLFMLDSKIRGKGIGKEIYGILEQYFIENKCEKIRIDVVYNYPQNVVKFGEKCGFKIVEKIEMVWSGKKSLAYMMIKALCEK